MQPEHILVAVDDSDSSRRSLRYVANIAARCTEFHLVLCHVLPPLPPGLLEFRGAEDPNEERAMDKQQEAAQARWLKQHSEPAAELLSRAAETLREAGVPAGRIETRLIKPVDHHGKLITSILDQAKEDGCRTIVVGRASFSWVRELLQSHLCNELVRQAPGFTTWVVE